MANGKRQDDLLQVTLTIPSSSIGDIYRLIERDARAGATLISSGLAHHGGLGKGGAPRAVREISGTKFLDQWITDPKNATFNTASMKIIVEEVGASWPSVAQALYKANKAGVIKRIGDGEYRVMRAASPRKKMGRPSKANGAAKPHKKVEAGAGEAAVLTRLKRANGAAVGRADLVVALEAAGASGNSFSGVVERLKKRGQIKKGTEKGQWIAV